MSIEAAIALVRSQPDAAWELAPLLPRQGEWSTEEYLWLSNRSRRLVEFADGYVEVLPMPTEEHQRILMFLYRVLYAFLAGMRRALVLTAGLRVRLSPERFREPELVALLDRDDPRRGNDYWSGADLVAEIVSPDDPGRDLVHKRSECAQPASPSIGLSIHRRRRSRCCDWRPGGMSNTGYFGAAPL